MTEDEEFKRIEMRQEREAANRDAGMRGLKPTMDIRAAAKKVIANYIQNLPMDAEICDLINALGHCPVSYPEIPDNSVVKPCS